MSSQDYKNGWNAGHANAITYVSESFNLGCSDGKPYKLVKHINEQLRSEYERGRNETMQGAAIARTNAKEAEDFQIEMAKVLARLLNDSRRSNRTLREKLEAAELELAKTVDTARELERWKRGDQVEGDFICADGTVVDRPVYARDFDAFTPTDRIRLEFGIADTSVRAEHKCEPPQVPIRGPGDLGYRSCEPAPADTPAMVEARRLLAEGWELWGCRYVRNKSGDRGPHFVGETVVNAMRALERGGK